MVPARMGLGNQHQQASSHDIQNTLQSLFLFSFFVEEGKHSKINLSLFTTFVKYIIELHIFISVKGKYLKLFILWRQGGKKEQTDQRKYLEKITLLEAKIMGCCFILQLNDILYLFGVYPI